MNDNIKMALLIFAYFALFAVVTANKPKTDCVDVAEAVEENNFDSLSGHNEKMARFIRRSVVRKGEYGKAYFMCRSFESGNYGS